MSYSWIKKLNSSDSRLHKEDVLRQALAAVELGSTNAHNFLHFTKLCYNPYVVFGVRKVLNTADILNAENPWDEFKKLLDDLNSRKITGNSAISAIETVSKRFDSEEWNNFCAPVIRRDLRAGISDKTINKICKDTAYEIPIFSCQLATNSEGRPEMSGIKRLEPKLDGVRLLMIVIPNDSAEVTTVCYSRNGKVFENFTHIEKQVADNFMNMCKSTPYWGVPNWANSGFVLDGEVMGNTFQELMRQARRKENVQSEDSVFNIFDIIPLPDFHRGYWNAPLEKRMEVLDSMRNVIDQMPNVELLPYTMVNLDTPEGNAQLDQYLKNQVNLGFEGIMVKSTGAPYECNRNTFWLKIKPVHDYDLKVVEVEEGTGKNLNRMGALVCEGHDDGKFIRVNVGSGYTDQERQSYWDNKTSIIGKTAVVLADAITKDISGNYSLRFPRFKCFREDK